MLRAIQPGKKKQFSTHQKTKGMPIAEYSFRACPLLKNHKNPWWIFPARP